jgi:hypothetical protein
MTKPLPPDLTSPIPFPTPESWRENRTLSICSLEARGLWIELLALMCGPPAVYEPLIDKKTKRLSINQLALLVSSSKRRIYAALEELEELHIIDQALWDHPVIPATRVPTKRQFYVRQPSGRRNARYAST